VKFSSSTGRLKILLIQSVKKKKTNPNKKIIKSFLNWIERRKKKEYKKIFIIESKLLSENLFIVLLV
jgi:hypothetical protein